MKLKTKRILFALLAVVMLLSVMSVTAFAAETGTTGDVAGAVEDTWDAAKGQIKQVVNNVIFPIIDLILAVLFFVKVAREFKRKYREIIKSKELPPKDEEHEDFWEEIAKLMILDELFGD